MVPQDQMEQATRGKMSKAKALSFLMANFWAITTVVIVTVVCLAVVGKFKKPGQMSVIESQSMDMSHMAPPEGAMPVAIERVEAGPIEGSVTYTGSVQAFEDEDVYPRLSGRIVRMPVYPGDQVRKGQLLVQLDPPLGSEYLVRLEEAKYETSAAMHNAGIAKEEFKEKQYQLSAAKDAQKEAQKALSETEAKLEYWLPEIKRQEALLKSKVVSQEEYDSELAESKAALAKVEQARDRLSQSTNMRLAAQAAFDGAVHHVGHVYDEAKKMEAAQQAAAITESYTRIAAAGDGVVTKRLLSPGVLVNPQMQILKIAHIKQVRLQAEVAAGDLARVRLGASVYVRGGSSESEELQAKVTAIFPSADALSRTSIVEALVDNVAAGKGQYRFLPGQYIVMRIESGRAEDALTVPTSAIVWTQGHGQVWKAAGSSSGSKVARLTDVEIGLTNPDRTEIRHGLKEGDLVISAGYAGLTPDMKVIGVEWGASGPQRLPSASETAVNRLDESNHWAISTMSEQTMIQISMAPQPPAPDKNTLIVTLAHHGGGAVTGCRLTARTSMPGMDMPGPDLTAKEIKPGTYELAGDFMAGLWEIRMKLDAQDGQTQEIRLELEVPQ